MSDDFDDRLRAAAFAYLANKVALSGGLVTRDELASFEFEGVRRLIAPQQGIWTPRGMEAAVSILTTFSASPEARPYDDTIGADGFARYKWRGTNPDLSDNRRLRRAMELGKCLIWLVGVAPSRYRWYPVWLVGEEADQQQFVVAMDETMRETWTPGLSSRSEFDPARRYAKRVVLQRLHQPVFRDQVLFAYESQCALCRLRHGELLDAAHIKEDSDGGAPIIPNGIAMCAIHHRAFDRLILGVRPDYQVEIRRDVMEEEDGPTLKHSLQGMDGGVLALPRKRRDRPDPELLEERYERFRAAG